MPLPDHPLPRALSIILALTTAAAVQAQGLSEACTALLADQRGTLIVPSEAGGGNDGFARAFAPVLSQTTGASFEVTNLDAAGGQVARATARDADPDALIMLVDNTADLVELPEQADLPAGLSGLAVLGFFDVARQVWLGKPDFAFEPDRGQSVVVGLQALENSVIDVGLTATALGMDLHVITGYSGSNEMAAAVLRGEVDLTSLSLPTAIKLSQAGDLSVILVLDDAPDPALPDVPYLAGPGGLAAELAAGLSAADQAEAMQMAQSVADASVFVRGIHVSAAMRPDLAACMAEAVDLALQDPALAAAIALLERPFNPQGGAQARETTQNLALALMRSADAVAEIYARHGD